MARSAGLVIAGAAVVLAGIAGGWSVVRALGGQSPMTTLNVTPASAQTQVHIDRLGFTVLVPTGWTEYREEPPAGSPSVSFVSPDGSEELVVRPAPDLQKAKEDVGSQNAAETGVEGVPTATELAYSTGTRASWRRILPGAGAPPSVSGRSP